MMMLRKLLFWVHLVVGIVSALVILSLCLSGALIAFEKEIIHVAETGDHAASLTSERTPLALDDILMRSELHSSGRRLSSVTVSAKPGAPVVLSYGRGETVLLDRYTGALLEPSASKVRRAMRWLTGWHRWLGRDESTRAAGKAITGAANIGFFFLIVSGLVLWLPRSWSLDSWRSACSLRWRVRGKSRDWNWHTVGGFWSSPVLLVLTLTGMVLSYRWAGDFLSRAFGSSANSAMLRPEGGVPPLVQAPERLPKPLTYTSLAALVQERLPAWEQMTFRMGNSERSEQTGKSEGGLGRVLNHTPKERGDRSDPSLIRASSAEKPSRLGDAENASHADNVRAVSVSVRERAVLPQYGSTQLWMDPYTGVVLKQEGYADYDAGRRLRMWLRFLHTGEALGLPGKTIAALASLFGAVLVWTGLALAWRRFCSRRRTGSAEGIPFAAPPTRS